VDGGWRGFTSRRSGHTLCNKSRNISEYINTGFFVLGKINHNKVPEQSLRLSGCCCLSVMEAEGLIECF